MAEGAPLERVQVVNSGARVQIPPSPFGESRKVAKKVLDNSTVDMINYQSCCKREAKTTSKKLKKLLDKQRTT